MLTNEDIVIRILRRKEMANCEFCSQSVGESAYLTRIGSIEFHSDCFRRAVKTLAIHSREQSRKSIKVIKKTPPGFLVIMDPNQSNNTTPRQYYEKYNQALAVAKKLAIDSGKNFFVVKHVMTISHEPTTSIR